jgi:hypothetical protein
MEKRAAPRSFESLYNNRRFSGLSEIVETKTILDDMIGYDFEDPKWWRQAWIPFLSNGGGSTYVLISQRETAASRGNSSRSGKRMPIARSSMST